MKRSTWKVIIIMLLVVVALAGFKFWRISAMIAAYSAMKLPPTTIAASPAQPLNWQHSLHATGSVVASQKVQISVELAGVVKRITFNSGEMVSAGRVLVELDNTEERARLDAAMARADLAEIKLRRELKLREMNVIAQSRLEETVAEAKQARAEVETSNALLQKKTICAPFAGRVSIHDISKGEYLAAGAAVVDIQVLDPIYVDFSVPQRSVALVQPGMKVDVTVEGNDASRLVGPISAVNPEVDTATRNLHVRATLQNSDEKLRPGMFVQVGLATGAPVAAVTVPTTALRHTPYAVSVFVVEQVRAADGTVHDEAKERFVDLGPSQGDRVVVLGGLKAGESVVVAGVFKLRDAMPVVVDNSVLPPDDSKQAPANS